MSSFGASLLCGGYAPIDLSDGEKREVLLALQTVCVHGYRLWNESAGHSKQGLVAASALRLLSQSGTEARSSGGLSNSGGTYVCVCVCVD